MKHLSPLAALSALILFTSCARDFSPPPDTVRIDTIAPPEGFSESLVTISGRNFDPSASNNLVFFGKQTASVHNATVEQLQVLVPVLTPQDEVSITVSTPGGQATAPDKFRYRGPGHPLSEKTAAPITLESGPVTISVLLPSERLTFFNPALVTNNTSRTIGLIDLDSGWHMDLGIAGKPLSGVLLPYGDTSQQGPNEPDWDPSCWHLDTYALYLSTLETQQLHGNGEQPDAPVELTTALWSLKLTLALKNFDNEANCGQEWIDKGASGSSFTATVADLPEAHRLDPSAYGPQDPPFMPHQVRALCLDLADEQGNQNWECRHRLLVATDLYRPLIAMATYSKTDLGIQVAPLAMELLSAAGSACAQTGEAAGPVLDLSQTPGQTEFLVVVSGRPEVWAIRLSQILQEFQIEDVQVAWPKGILDGISPAILNQTVWDRDVLELDAMCELRFTALARSSDPGRQNPSLYLAEQTGRLVLELEGHDLPAGLPTAFLPVRAFPLGKTAFALETAMAQDAGFGEMLYAATNDGLFISQASFNPMACIGHDDCASGACLAGRCRLDPMDVVDFIALPGSRGGPQSLVRYGHSQDTWNDEVVLVDTVRDRLLVLPVGDLESSIYPLPVGPRLPQLAASQFDDVLYLSDPLNNTIRMIDQATGVVRGKFPVHDRDSFGALGIACIHEPGVDLLLVPLANEFMDPTTGTKSFDKVVVRLASSMGEILGFEAGLDDPDFRDDYSQADSMAKTFHEMIVAPLHQMLILVQYAAPGSESPGMIWPAMIDPMGGLANAVRDGDEMVGYGIEGVDFEPRNIPESVSMVRLEPHEQWLASWELIEQGNDAGMGRISVFPLEDHQAQAKFSYMVAPPTSHLVSDMAFRFDRDMFTFYLTLGEAGQILVIRNRASGQADRLYLETNGAPARMFFSPDGRRLYVTHRSEGKLSVIDTDCLPPPECLVDEHCPEAHDCQAGFCMPQGQCEDQFECDEFMGCPPGMECIDHLCQDPQGGSAACPQGTRCNWETMACEIEFCDELRATLPVPANPDRITFHPSGKAAYLTHQGSNLVTVIE